MHFSQIWTLKPDEWAILREIRIRALIDSPEAFGSTLDREIEFTADDWKSRLERQDCATFVACFQGKAPIGLSSVAPYGGHAGLYSMWVAPQYRGRGVGSTLVDAVIDWARQKRYKRILLDVGDYNRPAIALYRSKGFIETGVLGALPRPREHISEHQRELILERHEGKSDSREH